MEVAIEDDKDIRMRLLEDGVMTCSKTEVKTILDNVNAAGVPGQILADQLPSFSRASEEGS